MPAKFLQTASAATQCFHEIEPFNAPTAPLPRAVLLEPDQDSGPVIFSRDARRDNPKNARMPAARVQDDRGIACRIELQSDLFISREKDLFLYFLAFPILLIEQCGQRCRFRFIVRQQESKRSFGIAQTSGSI